MATFSEIYFNGSEYTQMWFNGSKIWEKDNSGFPYSVDSVLTYMNTSYSQNATFTVIDNTLPYSINGVTTTSYTFHNGETQVKLVNLKPSTTVGGSLFLINVEQLRIPKATDLSMLFCFFGYDANYTCSWSPQYFEFNENPTDMSSVFYYCYHLTDDIMNQFMPYFPNTSSVTNMASMFYGCNKLTSLDLSNWDTSLVTDMGSMFSDCSSLTSLDLSSFNTSNVTDMSNMFYCCTSLTSLDLSHFNTSSTTTMSGMFSTCKSLTSLDLSNFNTSNVTSMGSMFQNCSALTSLDLSSFDTSNVTSTYRMFDGVKNCTVYISDKWSLGTSSTLGGGSGLKFVRINPITSITLESTLTDTTITRGTQFTITPTVIPSNHTDELVITYDTNALFMTDNVFTVLDGANIGAVDITYSSKLKPSISATYTITIRDYIDIASITLQHTLDSLIIEPNTTFTITPITTPTLHEDELLVEFDDTYITHNDGMFTITNAPFNESMSITYYSKANPSVNATLNLMVRDFIPITSITLEHTLDSLVIEPNTMFTITPVIVPTVNDDEVMIEFDDTYMAYNDGVFTVTNAPFNEPLSIKYSSKFDSTVYATLDLAVRNFIPITSITLQHTLETLVDVMVGTTFTVTPIIMPTIYDGLLVDYDTNYLYKNGNTFTVLDGASEQTVQIIYYSEYDNSVNAILEFNVVELGGLQPLNLWKADMIPLEWDGIVASSSETLTISYDLAERNLRATRTSSVGYSANFSIALNNSTTIFDSTKFYKLSYKIRGKAINGDTKWTAGYYAFDIYDGNTFTYYKEEENLLSETEWREENFVVCGINQFKVTFDGSSPTKSNWLEIKDIMYQEYDIVPPLPDTDIYRVADTKEEYSVIDLYNQGLVTENNSYAKITCNTETNTIGMEITSANKTSGAILTVGVPVGKFYVFSGTGSCTTYETMFKYGDVNGTITMNGSQVNGKTIKIIEDETYNKLVYVRTLNGYTERYMGIKRNTSTYPSGSYFNFTNPIFHIQQPLKQISLTHDIEDVTNVTKASFKVTPTLTPSYYSMDDIEVIYDSTYLSTTDNLSFRILDGSQGQTLDITYRSKTDNSISDTLTFTVSEDFEVPLEIDFTQSTAPTLPDYLTVDYNASYKFSHGTYTTNVYGLIPSNKGKSSSTAYTRYKLVAPKSGDLTFTYRCYAETNYDYLTVHVDTSTSQPSTTSATNQVFTTKGVSSYQNTDGTASVSVVEGTTYYIHIQYYKDSSTNSGYDMGCIRKIELI